MMYRSLVKPMLLPVVLAQGARVRRKALVLPEPEGPREGRIGRGDTLRVLIVGDSSAAGVGVGHQDQALSGHVTRLLAADYGVDWRLVARTGATTLGTLRKLREMDAHAADIAVVALGVNDLTNGVRLPRWLDQQRALHDLLRQRFGVRYVCVSGMPPVGQFPLLLHPLRWLMGQEAARFDAAIRDLAEQQTGCGYVPLQFHPDEYGMAEDGYHPGPDIYEAWAGRVADRILSDWPRYAGDQWNSAPSLPE